MARSMLSFGMLLAFASATAARSRGLPFGSPPPRRAATVISFRMRVKILPRFASAAPFLCLIVLHLLWPDMETPLGEYQKRADSLSQTGAHGTSHSSGLTQARRYWQQTSPTAQPPRVP